MPAGVLYGAHTVRALANFTVSGTTLRERPSFIAALGHVKAAARAGERGVRRARRASRGGDHRGRARGRARRARRQFPIDIVQGGGWHVGQHERQRVVANRANEILGGVRGSYDPVDPTRHVNRSQSTNDVYPTALALATVTVGRTALTGIARLASALSAKAAEGGALERLARTCLQDAVPTTVAATHRGHAHARRPHRGGAGRARWTSSSPVRSERRRSAPASDAPAGYRERALPLLAERAGSR